MRQSLQLKKSKKTMLLLYTELAEAYQKQEQETRLQTLQLKGE